MLADAELGRGGEVDEASISVDVVEVTRLTDMEDEPIETAEEAEDMWVTETGAGLAVVVLLVTPTLVEVEEDALLDAGVWVRTARVGEGVEETEWEVEEDREPEAL